MRLELSCAHRSQARNEQLSIAIDGFIGAHRRFITREVSIEVSMKELPSSRSVAREDPERFDTFVRDNNFTIHL